MAQDALVARWGFLTMRFPLMSYSADAAQDPDGANKGSRDDPFLAPESVLTIVEDER